MLVLCFKVPTPEHITYHTMFETVPPSQTKTDRRGSLPDEPVKKQDAILHAEHIESATSVEHVDNLVKTRTFDNSIDDTKPSKKVWTIIFTVAMGGFLFGYDTGYISAVLVSIGDEPGHRLSSEEQELSTSITSGGALIAGLPADKFGRKFGIYVGCALFIIGSIIQAAAFSVPQMTVGRFVVGLGVGSVSMIVPLYIGEISVAKYRGRMVALNNVSVKFGQLISYVLGAGFVHVSHGWRYMVAIGGVPPMLLAVLLIGCPESPRLLVMHQKIEQAKRALTSLYPYASETQVQSKIDLFIYAIEEEAHIVGSRSLWRQFKELHCIPANLRALTSAYGVMAISQLSGFNSILCYGATLFGLVGFKNPTAVSITIGGTNFIFNIVNFSVIDRAGRRMVLLVTFSMMVLSMTATAVAFHWIPVSKDLILLSTSTNWASIVVLMTIIVYVASFSSRGLTPSGTFGLYAGICFFSWIFVKFCFPEVNGMPLEDIRQIFEHGFGVKTAKGLQAVVIATATKVHAEEALEAIAEDLHLLCEKRISLSIDTSRRGETTSQSDVWFLSPLRCLLERCYEKAKAGVIGRPTIIRSQTCDKQDLGGFFIQYDAHSGGCLSDMSVHDIDLTLWFFGEDILAKSISVAGVVAVDPGLKQYEDRDNAVDQGIIREVPAHYYGRFKYAFVAEANEFTAAALDNTQLSFSLTSALRAVWISSHLQEALRTGKKLYFDEIGNRVERAGL
ncbi:hypothetical protein FHL15_007724 [Xylaria flabelliformis]|uniref:Major facilitator superfamily (MFS) profile domain-containing protein n=1 Tax=Xylaria flabelliformis TaxID=2512241 RepID=A0A553HTL9_9PEZI|nr:hypothetical protein FHL15_007724 [Xylaria flabelliformis]